MLSDRQAHYRSGYESATRELKTNQKTQQWAEKSRSMNDENSFLIPNWENAALGQPKTPRYLSSEHTIRPGYNRREDESQHDGGDRKE